MQVLVEAASNKQLYLYLVTQDVSKTVQVRLAVLERERQ